MAYCGKQDFLFTIVICNSYSTTSYLVANDILLHFALMVENMEDIPMIISYGCETLEIQFSDANKSP